MPSDDFLDEHVAQAYQQGDGSDFTEAAAYITQQHIGRCGFDGQTLFEQTQRGGCGLGIEIVGGQRVGLPARWSSARGMR